MTPPETRNLYAQFRSRSSAGRTAAGKSLVPALPNILFLPLLFMIFSPWPSNAMTVPERLVYDLTWSGIKAGTATLEVASDSDEKNIRIISTARSADWVSVFYLVDDRIEAVLRKGPSPASVGKVSTYRVKLREGRHRRDKEVVFEHGRQRAIFTDHIGNELKEFPINDHTTDPLSSLYIVRNGNIEVGKSVFVEIFDSKKVWNVEVQVLRKERLKTGLGVFDTVVIKPLMKSEGIFNRKGDVYIWLTDDVKRIPVKMQTKITVGSVTATLVGGEY